MLIEEFRNKLFNTYINFSSEGRWFSDRSREFFTITRPEIFKKQYPSVSITPTFFIHSRII